MRKQAHMTQKVFSEYLGVSLKTVEAWEAGRNKPQGPAKRMLSMIEADQYLFENFASLKKKQKPTERKNEHCHSHHLTC